MSFGFDLILDKLLLTMSKSIENESVRDLMRAGLHDAREATRDPVLAMLGSLGSADGTRRESGRLTTPSPLASDYR